MINRRRFLNHAGRAAATLGAVSWVQPSWAADEAIGSKHITVGNSIALTGPLGNAGMEHNAAIRAAFAEINKAGGIHGRELRFVTKDDGYAAARTVENVKQMIEGNSAFALMSIIGTPNTGAILPLTEKAGIPVLGPITGAASLRKAEHKYVFHIRPSYTDEVTRMVQQLVQMGIQDIAVVYLDNPFGKEVMANAQRVLGEQKLKAVAAIPLAVDGKNHAEVAQQVIDSKAGAVFMGTTGTGTTDMILSLREKAAGLPVIGLSVTFTDTKRLGKHLTGLAMASVFPAGNATKFAVVRAYQASLEAANEKAPLSLGLESWVNAQVMAEGIRRAGRDITRDKLRNALTSIHGFEVGEVVVNFGATGPYVGTSSVKLGIFGADGVLRA
ncbi:MAG TPA: ABC transporter substrate-binding protein [Rhizobacter sp.]|jgi:ABC-type branched-subunit amino acid transport system substrate-binding protein|nr:ABC transporter substrate-binding protein [Rhizobacter sp.]